MEIIFTILHSRRNNKIRIANIYDCQRNSKGLLTKRKSKNGIFFNYLSRKQWGGKIVRLPLGNL